MDSIEIEAKSVAEAITIACEELKTKHENLTIEVLQEAPNKIFAFMSGKKARIRATLIPVKAGGTISTIRCLVQGMLMLKASCRKYWKQLSDI